MDDQKIREIRIIRENPRFRRYPEYKESGVSWIGEIPSNWRSGRLKFHLSENSGGIWGEDDEFGNGTYVLRSTEITIDGHWDLENVIKRKLSKEEAKRFLLKKGDLIVTKSSGSQDHIGKTGLVDDTIEAMVACYSNFVQRLRPQNCINSKFLHYFMNCSLAREQYKYQSETTTGLANLNAQSINELFISVPPEQEQTQIANFLDRKMEQIDELIRIKERRIELLQEQRTALINQAVTKGLDSNVEMKPSGVAWIGVIPKHWKIEKIKYIATFVSAKSAPETDAIKISPENVESNTGKVLDFYSSYDSIGVKFQFGDVLFNKIRVYLNKVIFAEYDGYSLGEMIVIRPSLQDIGKFLFYLMLSSRFIEYCNSISRARRCHEQTFMTF